ncbi:clavesin-1-like [Argiope bruennichi]|uniref:clavesin-1-like n=1 Tax=Argiope bruennichi TaxID=94029 RepID=UPI002494A688|nr:clavesin-1-like [Argiope bruennichi]
MNQSMDNFLPYNLNNIEDSILLPCVKEINESPETKSKGLEFLRNELKKLQDIEPCLEESFLLRFLRVSKYNASNAFQRMLKYYKHQEVLLDSLKRISLHLEEVRSLNYTFMSPYRLKNHSVLGFLLAGNIDYSEMTFAQRFYLDILSLTAILDNPVNQITGFTIIMDYKGFDIRSFLAHTPSWTKFFVDTFLKSYPIRMKAAHIVNAPSIFLTVYRICYPFIPKKLQKRIFIHPNGSWKSLHSSVPPEVLPEEYGGKLKFDSCINILENIEALDAQFRIRFSFGYIKTKASRQSFRPLVSKNEISEHRDSHQKW